MRAGVNDDAAAGAATGLATPQRAASMLVFARRDRHFCSPFADVEEILEAPRLLDPGFPHPLLAAVLLHEGRLIPVVDPVMVMELPPEPHGIAIVLNAGGRRVALLADRVVGFRSPTGVGPAPWVPFGRMCRRVAMLEPWGQAFVLGADGVEDVPAVSGPAPVAGVPAAGGLAARQRAAATCLTYTIAGRDYASGYGDIQRILYRQPLFRIPGGGIPLRYAVEVNGAIVPVLELAFAEPAAGGGLPDHAHPAALATLIVLHSPHGAIALRVDAIGRPQQLIPDRTDAAWFPSPGVAGLARQGDRPYSLVNGAVLVRDLLDGSGEAERGAS